MPQIGAQPIDFGISEPQGSADAVFVISRAPSDAILSAIITDDNSKGRFRILSLKSYAEGNGSAAKQSIEGSGPLKVARGERVEAALRFYSLIPKGQDDFEATLEIRDSAAEEPWKPIYVRLRALVAGFSSTLPLSAQIQRGQRIAVPVTLVSHAGPATIVSYTLRSGAGDIYMAARRVRLERGKSITASLEFTAAADARLGAREVMVESAGFDGKLTKSQLLPVIVYPSQPDFADVCGSMENAAASPVQENQTWTNWGIIDSGATILGALPTAKLFQPGNQYEIAQAVREAEAAGKTMRALGSGWSFSDAVLPQAEPVEGTNATALRTRGLSAQLDESTLKSEAPVFSASFGYAIDTTGLNRSLQAVLPNILADNVDVRAFFFVEAGITIHALNEFLNGQTPRLALKTMGGASGQTICGAFSTGTHGGDFDRPPLADSVRAIYLIGEGGTHHWLEPSAPITDRAKIQAAFPCIQDANIQYEDDLFRAALVSMGGMGVIYAVVLEVVEQYSLMQRNRWSTWEDFKAEQMEVAFSSFFDGSWTGLTSILDELGIQDHSPNRFAQVVINPIRRDDGKHTCYVSNRVQLTSRPGFGVAPLADYTRVPRNLIRGAITCDPNFGHSEALNFNFHGPSEEGELLEVLRNLIAFCKSENYPWAVRAVIDLVMQKTFPRSSTRAGGPAPTPRRPRSGVEDRFQPEPAEIPDNRPQLDTGFRVMAPGGTSRAFPTLGSTSVESAFSFFPRSDHPGADVVTYVDALLNAIDQWVNGERMFPAGWLSLRVTGQTSALLGMERFDRNGMVEMSLVGTPDDYAIVRRAERLALDMGGALHWGQSNGALTRQDLELAYGNGNIAKWRDAQRRLGGETFVNFFMKRSGLIPSPLLRAVPQGLAFGTVTVGDISPARTFRIVNDGSGELQVSLAASVSGSFIWGGFSVAIPPGGEHPVSVEFAPQAYGTQSRTLLLESNAPGSPHPVALRGNGYRPPADRPDRLPQ